ncbi:MAG: cardiolipin synthase [Tannerella sp.]|jgi:cardiolipin synthase|nr:cardiolipin synthase [Tannerella sp.]
MLTQGQIQIIIGLTLLILYSVSIVSLVLVVLLENRNPLKTIPWVVVLLFLPGVGLILYFVFGQDNRRQRIISRRTYKRIMQPLQSDIVKQDRCKAPDIYQPLVRLLNRGKRNPLLYGSDITCYNNGVEKFDALMEAIGNAKHHIHLQYYIFADDEIGRKVKKMLIEKAGEGVEVRVLYDDVGSWDVKNRFFQEMRAAGIEVHSFLRVFFPIFSSKVNYRNHRKIVVIDGVIGFMGGMNIADRYVKGATWGPWRDLHFKIEGKGVHGLQSAFLIDWYVASKLLIRGKAYYPDEKIFGDNIMQIVTSGPVGPWRNYLQAVTFSIANAKKYVYIQTPYFLPTDALNQALQTVALGGVDVRLMLPKNSDTRTANLASHSFLDDMVKAGVKIYFYHDGFLHSKLLLIDDLLTSIGSANIDFRSFEHNFEINAFVYQESFAHQMKKHFLDDMNQHCERLIPAKWLKRSIFKRIAESFMRLFSPLL